MDWDEIKECIVNRPKCSNDNENLPGSVQITDDIASYRV